MLLTICEIFTRCIFERTHFYIYIGFFVHRILELLKEHPANFMQLLCPSEDTKLTADLVETLFTPEFSPLGSNKRNLEMAIFMNWHEFLEDVESKVIM